MTFSVVDSVSSPMIGKLGGNEDQVGFRLFDSSLFAWVIDGATSVSECNYIDNFVGDAAWYARELSLAIMAECSATTLKNTVQRAVREVTLKYARQTRDAEVPTFAKPIAALSIVKVYGDEFSQTMESFSLGDCQVYTSEGSVISKLPNTYQGEEPDIDDSQYSSPATQWRNKLHALRMRRTEQMTADVTEVATVLEARALGGSEITSSYGKLTAVVLLTDGMARYSTLYRLGKEVEMINSILADGSKAALKKIRDVESGDWDARMFPRLKASDDASCLVVSRDEGLDL